MAAPPTPLTSTKHSLVASALPQLTASPKSPAFSQATTLDAQPTCTSPHTWVRPSTATGPSAEVVTHTSGNSSATNPSSHPSPLSPPYSENTKEATPSSEDSTLVRRRTAWISLWSTNFGGVEDGILAWITVGLDVSADYSVSSTVTWTVHGGLRIMRGAEVERPAVPWVVLRLSRGPQLVGCGSSFELI